MRRATRGPGCFAALCVCALSGCDLSATNPGRVGDDALNDPGAHAALITGMSIKLARAVTLLAFLGADAAKEYTQAGRGHPIKLPVVPGQLTVDGILDDYWNAAQQARWVAEDGVRRLRTQLGDAFHTSAVAAQALLHAGYANRLLAENMCEAVIDGGPVQSHHVFLIRADEQFGEAIAIADAAGAADLRLAARAGRASVRLYQRRYEEAASDAAAVPDDFAHRARYSAEREELYNFVYYASANSPWRAHSVVGTWYERHYADTGDPRVSWSADPAVPNAEFAAIPWHYQTKFTSRDASISLSTGREMRLLEAEVALRTGAWPRAIDLLNGLRRSIRSVTTGAPLAPLTAVSAADAWTHLRRERASELWLEARRLGDHRRWIADGAPGEMEDLSDRVRLCIPVSEGERRANPHIDLTHQDPRNPLYAGTLR